MHKQTPKRWPAFRKNIDEKMSRKNNNQLCSKMLVNKNILNNCLFIIPFDL